MIPFIFKFQKKKNQSRKADTWLPRAGGERGGSGD